MKIFESILLRRFQTLTDKLLRDNQAGFCRGKCCCDKSFSLRMLLSKRLEFRQPMCIVFIDFKAAFDSVSQVSLWKILEVYGMPRKLIAIFRALYTSTKCAVQVNGKDSGAFSVNTGVKQDANSSPVLFNFVIDWVMHKAVESYKAEDNAVGVSLGDQQIIDLEYVDDILNYFDTHTS